MGGKLQGRLLVATPLLSDGVFDRTVVLVVEHNEEGAMGLVLNEPTLTPVVDALPRWADFAADPNVVFIGGPVDDDVVFGLGRGRSANGGEGWTPIVGPVGVVDLARDPGGVGVALERMRLFVGYAGWGPGQVEREVASGAWFDVDAEPDDPFGDPAQLWRTVLRRQGGSLALHATYPDDPSLN